MPGSDGPSIRAVIRVVAIVVVSALTLWLIYVLRKPITWIVIAGFIAIAVSGPIAWLQNKKIIKRRGLAVFVVYFGLIMTPVVIAAVLVPPIVTQANNLIDKAPQYAKDVEDFAHKNATLRKLEKNYDITGKLQEQAAKLPSKISGAAGVLSDIGLGIVNSLFAGLTILILSIFMVGSGSRWIEAAIGSRPASHRPILRRAATDIANAVGGYVAGALGQATIAGFTAFVVLSILGVPYAAALSLIIALLDLVPLVGATLGAILVGIITLFQDFPTATLVWVVYSVVYQQVENTVIQPRIQSRSVNIQPIVVLIAVLFGSSLFGILGALLAIPFAAAIQICIREYRSYREAVRVEQLTEPPPEGGLVAPA